MAKGRRADAASSEKMRVLAMLGVTVGVAAGTVWMFLADIDSAGLGAIIESFTAARNKAVRLTLLNPTERTRHLLEITGLARIVVTFDSEAAALASCDTVEGQHVVSSAPER